MKNKAGIAFKILSDEKYNLLKLDITLNSVRQIYIDEIADNIKRNKENHILLSISNLKSELRFLTRDFSKDQYPDTIESIEDSKIYNKELKKEIENIK